MGTMSKPAAAKSSNSPTTKYSGFGLSQVWVRFLVAIVGLILAFAAALFSTVARESGNV